MIVYGIEESMEYEGSQVISILYAKKERALKELHKMIDEQNAEITADNIYRKKNKFHLRDLWKGKDDSFSMRSQSLSIIEFEVDMDG